MEQQQYILKHADAEDKKLHEIAAFTKEHFSNNEMMSGHLQAVLLKIIASLITPSRILELGTYVGYSSIALAKTLSETGKLFTIEKNKSLKEIIYSNFKKCNVFDAIEVHFGDAAEIIPTLKEVFDLVYIDANKKGYVQQYEAVFPKVRSGGVFLVDNVLWKKKVLSPEKHKEDKTLPHILTFNEHIKNDKRVEKIILPIRDGIFLIRKK